MNQIPHLQLLVFSRTFTGGICRAQFLTCSGVILGDPDQGVAHSRLVVGQAGSWDTADHIISIRWLHLHRDSLQELIVQGVRAIKLQQGTGKSTWKHFHIKSFSPKSAKIFHGMQRASCILSNSAKSCCTLGKRCEFPHLENDVVWEHVFDAANKIFCFCFCELHWF